MQEKNRLKKWAEARSSQEGTAMSTAQDIITAPFVALQVVAQGETPDADQLSDGPGR